MQHQYYCLCEWHLPAVQSSCRFHWHHTLFFAVAVLLTSPWTELFIAHERFLHVGTCAVFFVSQSFKIPIPNFLSYYVFIGQYLSGAQQKLVRPREDSGRVIHALQSHHNHLISTQLLNIISQCFLLLSASTCLVVCKEICILSQQGKPQTNLQRRKSCGIRHENHKDFFSFSLILPLSLLLPALCQLIKSTE